MRKYISYSNIRVALIARSTLYTTPGGDTVQIEQTACHLAQAGVIADIWLTHEQIDYQQYTLLHFFNIIRPADILYHIRRSSKPFVVSTILVDYSEFDKAHRKGPGSFIFRWFSPDTGEYIKGLLRWLKGKDRIRSGAYLLQGQRRSVQDIINRAAMLLPNSQSEYNRLVQRYQMQAPHVVVPNGIDEKLFTCTPGIERNPRLVICVARIEGIKNQINLIKALNNTPYQLLLIGAPAPNQPGYYKACHKIAGRNVIFIYHLSQRELLYYYQRAGIHVLPSWFETTGLSSLEAAAMGCKLVITDKGDTREYFEDLACYCDPSSPASIYAAVEKAYQQPDQEMLRKKIISKYTWTEATLATSRAYKQVIQCHEATHRNFRYEGNPQSLWGL